MIVKKVQKNFGKDWVWRLTPYASMQQDTPPLRDLIYQDTASNDPQQKMGGHMFIGTSMSTPNAYVEGNETIIESKNSERLSCYSGGVDVCVGV